MGTSFLNTGTVRAFAIILSVTAIHFGSLCSRVCANATDPLQEHQVCEQITDSFEKFVSQVMSHAPLNCDDHGTFPQPGNCSVFFKCIQSEDRIQPIVEYCAMGYNFVKGVCIPNTNSSDCPQYTCRIPKYPDDTGNEVINSTPNDNLNLINAMADALHSNPVTSSEGPALPASIGHIDHDDEQSTLQPEILPQHKEEIHEQFMPMTQTNEKSGASPTFPVSSFTLLFPVIFFPFELNFLYAI